jgi:tetratricopeptide (TPR) repeat protein
MASTEQDASKIVCAGQLPECEAGGVIFSSSGTLPNLLRLGYAGDMKRIAAFLILLFGYGLLTVRAQQNADGLYLNIYSAIQQADVQLSSGDLSQALAKYTEVQSELQQFQNAFPDWNRKIVTFRLKYVGEKIAEITTQLPRPAPAGIPSIIATNNVTVAPASAAETATANLHYQLEVVQSENATLLAKLKEALSAQPALADAGELTKAQELIRSLLKENDLLKASAVQGHVAIVADTNTSALVKSPAMAESTGELETMHEENALLKNQLAAANTSAGNATETEKINADLKQAQLQIAALQSAGQVAHLENVALENRLQQLQGATSNVAAPVAADQLDNQARIRELTQERDNLLAKVSQANKQLYGTKKQDAVAQVDQLTDQIRTLRERLAVAEAQPVPYTSEELGLLKQSAPQLATGKSQKKSVKELPAGSAVLVAEAQRFFSAKQYDQAEADYLKILEQDPNNALVLGNLAAIEMQEGKLDVAEKHIQAAIIQDPNDAFNLATLGFLKFRQDKFDEALDVLSRATKLDPQNPEILNYLGVTLSHKGLRPQAEAALRKSIVLNPDYAAAHNNLAAIYISQDPPLVELARWHYQKALAAGQPHNPELEKALAEKGTPSIAP